MSALVDDIIEAAIASDDMGPILDSYIREGVTLEDIQRERERRRLQRGGPR